MKKGPKEKLTDDFDGLPREDQTVSSYLLPKHIGEGIFYTGRIRPGLSIIYADYRLRPGATSVREVRYGTDVLFRFRLTGKVALTYRGHDGVFEFDASTCGAITTHKPMIGIAREESTGDRKIHIMLRCSRRFLKEHIGHHGSPLTKAIFEERKDRAESPVYCDVRPLPPHGELTIQQVIRCPYEDEVRRLFLEAKSLELIALYLGSEGAPKGRATAPVKFSAAEIESVKSARDIIGANLTDPPPIERLAKMVGMKSTKLKLGFQHVFGRTAFNYLRERRMELAKQMLSEGKLSIEEVGRAAGFTNASHFTQAFQKHYGVLPKTVRGQQI